MAKPIENSKTIYDPLWGIIDITEYLPMIDVPEFQALGFKYQLGVTSLLFPAASHTRKQHSFGSFKRSSDLAQRWFHRGFISEYDTRLIAAYGLWHDIGHGPFSHVVEEITKELWGRN
ncbi:MAG: HD domain-containing protein, partial [Planctomycetes bacterium]|nr:HD domain-containing protein [Planctomycetota bacterium]